MAGGSTSRGLLLVAGATLFWSLSGVFVRWLPGIDPWSFNAFRGLGLALSMALWIALRYGSGTLAMVRRSPPSALAVRRIFFGGLFALHLFPWPWQRGGDLLPDRHFGPVCRRPRW